MNKNKKNLRKKTLSQKLDKTLSKSMGRQLSVLIVATFAVFLILLLGSLIIHWCTSSEVFNFWKFASHFINPGSFLLGDKLAINVWGLITGIFGMVFLSGLLISVLSNILERRVEQVKKGQVYYPFENHLVIIGYDSMTTSLVNQLVAEYKDTEIVIQTVQEVPQIRHELFAHITKGVEEKITFFSGNRTSVDDLRRLCLSSAKEVFLLGEMKEFDHDSLNIDCLRKINSDLLNAKEKRNDRLRCHVQFEYQSTYAVFQQQDLDMIKKTIDFVPFNFYESWARKVFVDQEYTAVEGGATIKYIPLDHEPITEKSNKKVHLVVLGMSRLGTSLGIEAMHLCHFPNFVTKGIKSRITFIDDHADREMNYLKGRYRHLFDEVDVYYTDTMNPSKSFARPNGSFTDIELEFIKGRVESDEIQTLLTHLSEQKDIFLTIAVCFSSASMAIATGLYFPDKVYENNIPILLRQETSYCTIAMLSKRENKDTYSKYKNIRPFGMLDNSYDLREADDLLPMIVNYVYDYPEADLSTISHQTFEQAWNRLSTALKWSNRYNANMLHTKMRSFGLTENTVLQKDQLGLIARVEHNRWVIEKLLFGFRAPNGPDEQKNDKTTKAELKSRYIHTDICAYDDLEFNDKQINARTYDINISKALPFLIYIYNRQK